MAEERPHVKPYFTKKILDLEVVEGSAARFDCKIEGTLNNHVCFFLSFLVNFLHWVIVLLFSVFTSVLLLSWCHFALPISAEIAQMCCNNRNYLELVLYLPQNRSLQESTCESLIKNSK